jgi:hypothetical protein
LLSNRLHALVAAGEFVSRGRCRTLSTTEEDVMGRLIVSAQMTMDSVMDQLEQARHLASSGLHQGVVLRVTVCL